MARISKKICRFCMHQQLSDDSNEIIGVFEGIVDLPEKISHCTGINLTPEDKIPPAICQQCISLVEKFNSFIEMCHNSARVLCNIAGVDPSSPKLNNRNIKPETSNNRFSNENIDKSPAAFDEIVDCDISSIDSRKPEDFENKSDSDISTNEDVSKGVGQKKSSAYLIKRKKRQKSLSPNSTNVSQSVEKNSEAYNMDITGLSEVSNYTCGICSQEYTTFFDYQDHQETHNGQLVFCCTKCSKVFSERQALVKHELTHKIPCKFCPAKLKRKSLAGHLQKHTDRFRCPPCKARHSSRAALEKHFKARHAGIKGFVCHICGKQSSCQSSLKRHMAYHSLERPHKCRQCTFATKAKGILKVHTSRAHNAQPCICEICARKFKSRFSLEQHKRRIHAPRKHVCHICSKAFAEKFNLDKHLFKKHSQQRIYDCKTCKKEFFTVKELKEHMHTHRNGCVSCPKCAKQFFYKKALDRHMANCASDTNGEYRQTVTYDLKDTMSLPNSSFKK